jgi:SAM-dependent methyltransferase
MRRLARESIAQGDAVGWFDALYKGADGRWDQIPWADLSPNPYLVAWLASEEGRRCPRTPSLVVGCGLGDDAEALASAGFSVTAFDVSATAIEGCHARFPESRVHYAVADALAPPPSWAGGFGLVFESYTLQVLPPPARVAAGRELAQLVAPGGLLLVLCRGRDATDPIGELPWPLTREELQAFREHGLSEMSFESFLDDETPPVRRFRALYARNSGAGRPLNAV